jgi:hypothetical protein
MPGGRPTLYRDEYCAEVVEDCADGYSLTGFAAKIGVARQTITEWCDKHPEFSASVSRAKAARARWWEDRARGVALEGGPGGQATMVIFGLKNHAPEDYADRQEIVGAGGKDLIPPADIDTQKLALALVNVLQAAKKE